MAKQKKRHHFWHPATYGTLRTAGELEGGRWEASSSLSLCLLVCWLQAEHSLPLLLAEWEIPLLLSHTYNVSVSFFPRPLMGHWPGALNQLPLVQHTNSMHAGWSCFTDTPGCPCTWCDVHTQSGRNRGIHSSLNYAPVSEMMNLVND